MVNGLGPIAILGPPGAGKTTLVQQIQLRRSAVQSFGVRHFFSIEAPDAMRAEAAMHLRSGGLVPDEIVFAGLRRFLADTESPLILLDNFPGTTAQASQLQSAVGYDSSDIPVLVVTASDSTCTERIRLRRTCARCGLVAQDHAGRISCDRCAGALVVRPDDSVEIAGTRLADARLRMTTILPLLGTVLHTFEGTRPVPDLVADALQLFDDESQGRGMFE